MAHAFERHHAPNGVVFYRCPSLSAPHGFSTRLGGVSEGAFASLNLGLSSGDAAERVQENRARWHAALGLAGAPHSLHQVHGAEVHRLETMGSEPSGSRHGDAIISALPARPIGVFTADCGPVLISTDDGAAVGAIHAGWRGTAAEIAARAVGALSAHAGVPADRIVAAIGPMIRRCCFEVGEEVVAAMASHAWFSADCVVARPGRNPLLDLPGLLRRQLVAAGLREDHLHDGGLCTVCRPEEFHSWRRDGAVSGRLQAVIAPARAGGQP